MDSFTANGVLLCMLKYHAHRRFVGFTFRRNSSLHDWEATSYSGPIRSKPYATTAGILPFCKYIRRLPNVFL